MPEASDKDKPRAELKEYAERQVHATHPALYIAVECCMLLSAVMFTICTVEAARA